MLTEKQLWARIGRLLGRVVLSIDKKQPSQVALISATKVWRRDPKTLKQMTGASRGEILGTYRYLLNKGYVTGDDFEGNLIDGKRWGSRNGRFILVLLAEAWPEGICVFPRDNEYRQGQSGIALRK